MADMFLADSESVVTKAEKPKSREAISTALRFHIMRRDDFTCQYCGASAPDTALHVDHIRPVVRGGTNDPSNLIVACIRCNTGKGARNAKSDDERPLTKREREWQSRAHWYDLAHRRLAWIHELHVGPQVRLLLFSLSTQADPFGTSMTFDYELAKGTGLPLDEVRSVIRGMEATGFVVPMEGHLHWLAGGLHYSLHVNSDKEPREYGEQPKRMCLSDYHGDVLSPAEWVYG